MTSRQLGGMFAHEGVAAAYRFRPPYPAEVFDVLERLITDEPRTVLDLGAGEGALARPLAARVERVDAVDIAAAMVEVGQQQPGGGQPNLRWIVSPVETAELDGPYALVTAGASLHWMDWKQTVDRLLRLITPNAQLAVVEHGPTDLPWQDELIEVIRRHSRDQNYDPTFSVVQAMEQAGLLEPAGSTDSAPMLFRQPVGEYVEQFHSRATLAREHMSEQEAADFGAAVERLVGPWVQPDGTLELPVVATVSWGRPVHA